jgi:hypothetical protein
VSIIYLTNPPHVEKAPIISHVIMFASPGSLNGILNPYLLVLVYMDFIPVNVKHGERRVIELTIQECVFIMCKIRMYIYITIPLKNNDSCRISMIYIISEAMLWIIHEKDKL